MTKTSFSPDKHQVPIYTSAGTPPKDQVKAWVKFISTSLGQVNGFFPKLRAIARIISILTKR